MFDFSWVAINTFFLTVVCTITKFVFVLTICKNTTAHFMFTFTAWCYHFYIGIYWFFLFRIMICFFGSGFIFLAFSLKLFLFPLKFSKIFWLWNGQYTNLMFCTFGLMSTRFSWIALIMELWQFSLFWEVTANIADWQSENMWRLSFEREMLSLHILLLFLLLLIPPHN